MRLWPFGRRAEQPDEMLGAVKQGVLAAISALGARCTQLEHALKLTNEEATESRAIERRLHKVELLATSTRELLVDQVARIDQTIQSVRGMSTGGRGGRPRAVASEIGEQLIAICGGNPDQALALVSQIAENAASMNGGGGNGAPSAIMGDAAPAMRRA